jgi:MFS family permease
MNVAVVDIVKEYNYTSSDQGIILSSFYIGYMLPQLVAGYLAGRFGGFPIVLFGILVPSILTLITPYFAGTVISLVAVRILTGLAEGVTYPALHSMLAEWAPEAERSTLLNVCWSGAFFGTATTFPLAGSIANGNLVLPVIGSGWKAIFYSQGCLGIAWAVLFVLTCASTPARHRWISAAERELIEKGVTVKSMSSAGKGRVPWLALLTNRAVWSCVAAHFAHNYMFYLMLSEMPTYLKYQLGYDLAKAGAISVLPYLACFVGANVGGGISDYLIAQGTPKLFVRRLWFALGELLPATALISAGFIHSPTIAIVLITISVGVSGIAQSSYACTPLDVAPHLAGPWMAFQNTFATMPGIIAPLIVAAIADVEHKDLQSHWQLIFFLSGAVSVSGVTVYVLGVKCEIDPSLAYADIESIDDNLDDVQGELEFGSSSTLERLVDNKEIN